MIHLPELTIYISHTCDLACDSCFTFNNLNWGGHLPINKDVEKLKGKVFFDEIFLIGGEPTLHPNLNDWKDWVNLMWPDSKKWIVTNGRHLDKINFEDNWFVEISAHSVEDLENILLWLKTNDIRFEKFTDNTHTDADVHYKLFYKDKEVGELSESWHFYKLPNILKDGKNITWMRLNDRDEQHFLCPTKKCMHLLNGKFYRCQQQAILPQVGKTFQIDNLYKEIATSDVGCYSDEFLSWVSTKDTPQEQCKLCCWGEKFKLPEESKIKKIKILKIQE